MSALKLRDQWPQIVLIAYWLFWALSMIFRIFSGSESQGLFELMFATGMVAVLPIFPVLLKSRVTGGRIDGGDIMILCLFYVSTASILFFERISGEPVTRLAEAMIVISGIIWQLLYIYVGVDRSRFLATKKSWSGGRILWVLAVLVWYVTFPWILQRITRIRNESTMVYDDTFN